MEEPLDRNLPEKLTFIRDLHKVYGWPWTRIARLIGVHWQSIRNWCLYGITPHGPSITVLDDFLDAFTVAKYPGGEILRYRGFSMTPKYRTLS